MEKKVAVQIGAHALHHVKNAVEAAQVCAITLACPKDILLYFGNIGWDAEYLDNSDFVATVEKLLSDASFVADAVAAGMPESAADATTAQQDACAKASLDAAWAKNQQIYAAEKAAKEKLAAENAAYRVRKAQQPQRNHAAEKDAKKVERQARLRDQYAAEKATKDAAELSARQAIEAEKLTAEKAAQQAVENLKLQASGSQWLPANAYFGCLYEQPKSYGQQIAKLTKLEQAA